MPFDSKEEVLRWYESRPRALTDDFIAAIPWAEVRRYPFDRRLIPVLEYMRDVEILTDMYHKELRGTPTGRDPVISKFMERWGIEEVTHGEVINMFLNELGIRTGRAWKSEVRKKVPLFYHVNTALITALTNLAGSRFTATHMTFGAVHEMTTAQSYRRMIEISGHPILEKIFRAIITEESAHTNFYWSVARLELRKNKTAQRLARFVLENFYYPVGQGSLGKTRCRYSVVGLFGQDSTAFETLNTTVTERVGALPGFSQMNSVSRRIEQLCVKHADIFPALREEPDFG